jgi:transcriptional adapter 2-alpha
MDGYLKKKRKNSIKYSKIFTKKHKKIKSPSKKKRKISKSSKISLKNFTIEIPIPNKKGTNNKNEENILFQELDYTSQIKIQCVSCAKDIANEIKILLPLSQKTLSSLPSPSKPINTNNNLIHPNSHRHLKKSNSYNLDLKNYPYDVICVNCFLNKIKNSKNEKIEYFIVDKFDKKIFTDDWTLFHELKLLGGIEKLGLDNWDEISKNIGKGKVECESHYYTFYYKDSKNYLPNENELCINRKINKLNKEKENKLKEKIKLNPGLIPLSSSENITNNRSRVIKNRKNKKDNKNNAMLQTASEILGFWPKREEFDVEYENDCELDLSELEFLDTDSKEEYERKMKIIKIYNVFLDERYKRRKFVIDRHFFDVKKQFTYERKLNKDDREIYNCLKPFLKYIDNDKFHEIFEGFVLEKNLKQRLNQLIYYKNLGCKTYEDIQKIIELEAKKINEKENKGKKRKKSKSENTINEKSLRSATSTTINENNNYLNGNNKKK